MLIRVIIGNLYSFREKTEFNMLTGEVRRHPHHVHKLGKVEVLRAAAVYGANGAGKSNLVKALNLLKESATKEQIPADYIAPFKLNASADSPHPYIEIEVNVDKKNYIYGLELTHNRIADEWLYESGLGEKPDILIFERKTDENDHTKIIFAPKYQRNAKTNLRREIYENEILKSQTSMLWQLNQAKEVVIKEAADIFNWIGNRLVILSPDAFPLHFMARLLDEGDFRNFTSHMMQSLDTGVVDFTSDEELLQNDDMQISNYKEIINFLTFMQKSNPGKVPIVSSKEYDSAPYAILLKEGNFIKKTLKTIHKNDLNKSIDFYFEMESDGTKKIIDYLLIFYELIHNKQTFIIDEIERSIHPSLIKSILQKIMTEENIKGQLIFTTHESNLLDLNMLRQDEIWFAEKDAGGATSFYPLSDFDIRPDLDIEKGYLMGRFGAIPMLNDLKKLNWHQATHAEN